jgi:hypothetical protein
VRGALAPVVVPSACARRSTWAKCLAARYKVYRRYSCGDYAVNTPHVQDIRRIFCGEYVVLSPHLVIKQLLYIRNALYERRWHYKRNDLSEDMYNAKEIKIEQFYF